MLFANRNNNKLRNIKESTLEIQILLLLLSRLVPIYLLYMYIGTIYLIPKHIQIYICIMLCIYIVFDHILFHVILLYPNTVYNLL